MKSRKLLRPLALILSLIMMLACSVTAFAGGPEDDTDIPYILFTNKNDGGNLTVKKTVTGNGGDMEKQFNFRVKLSDRTVNGQLGEMEFTDGVAEFKLKNGETKTAEGIPSGVTYTVTESEANQGGYKTTSDGASGSIKSGETATASFTNEIAVGGLSVAKTVVGSGGEREREFNFKVELSDKTVSGTYGQMTFTNGVAQFTLHHGETKTAEGLPSGVTYTVTEAEANTDSYTTKAENDTGSIETGQTAAAAFTNKRVTVLLPLTGGPGVTAVLTLSFLACVAGAALVMLGAKRKKKI